MILLLKSYCGQNRIESGIRLELKGYSMWAWQTNFKLVNYTYKHFLILRFDSAPSLLLTDMFCFLPEKFKLFCSVDQINPQKPSERICFYIPQVEGNVIFTLLPRHIKTEINSQQRFLFHSSWTPQVEIQVVHTVSGGHPAFLEPQSAYVTLFVLSCNVKRLQVIKSVRLILVRSCERNASC